MTISVVIPTYNGSRFIEQAILSVLGQHRKADQIIISDDNSSDNTLEICHRYKEYITIHTNPAGPSGFVNGWNNAIAKAGSDYISVLHQDDTLSPEFIRMGMEALESHPEVRHLFVPCRYVDHEDRTLAYSLNGNQENSPETLLYITGKQYARTYQAEGYPHIHRCPGVITHRSIFEQCRYEPAAGHIADDDFFYRVGMYTDVIGIMMPLASYRIHSASVTGSMEDMELARHLMDDYLYQCRQWKEHPFMQADGYQYFVGNARKYIRRSIGYGLKKRQPAMILKGLRQWLALYRLLNTH